MQGVGRAIGEVKRNLRGKSYLDSDLNKPTVKKKILENQRNLNTDWIKELTFLGMVLELFSFNSYLLEIHA